MQQQQQQQQQPQIPPASPNGGLYTGAAFESGAPWANAPVTPDAGYYNFGSLRAAGAPVAAMYMVPGGGLRPGNNTPLLPANYAENRIGNLNAICVPDSAYATAAPSASHGFRSFAYVV